MNFESNDDWLSECMSFLISQEVATFFRGTSKVWTDATGTPPKHWFNWHMTSAGGAPTLRRFNILDERGPNPHAKNWLDTCDQYGITPVVVIMPGEDMKKFRHVATARAAFLEPDATGGWSNDGWLLGLMAAPDAFVLSDWQALRQGFRRNWDRERFNQVVGFWQCYADAFCNWVHCNVGRDVQAGEFSAFNPKWSEGPGLFDNVLPGKLDVHHQLHGKNVRVIVQDAKYLQFSVPVGRLQNANAAKSGLILSDDEWVALDEQLVSVICDKIDSDAENKFAKLSAPLRKRDQAAMAASVTESVSFELFAMHDVGPVTAGAELGRVELRADSVLFRLFLPDSLCLDPMHNLLQVNMPGLGLQSESEPLDRNLSFRGFIRKEVLFERGPELMEQAADMAAPVILTIGAHNIPCGLASLS